MTASEPAVETAAAPGADLVHAPPPIRDGDRTLVFVDFVEARYDIAVDAAAQTTEVTAEIDLWVGEPGLPLFELNAASEHLSVSLDGEPVETEDYLPEGSTSSYKVVCAEADAGAHRLHVSYRFENLRTTPAPVQWVAGGAQVSFAYSDVVDDSGLTTNRFLGSYLPSNMEYDHFEMVVHVEVANSERPHALVTNAGRIAPIAPNRWRYAYPAHFTTSCPFLNLVPEDMFWFSHGTCSSIDGRELALLVYAARSQFPSDLDHFLAAMQVGIGDLESQYGAFPYPWMTVRAMPPSYGGGMEYAGATMSEYWVLRHELQHCYFARCILPVSGDAGWIDEAIAAWEDYGFTRLSEPPPASPSGLVSGNPYARVTQHNAYTDGAQFLSYLDHLLDNRGGLRAFLRHYYEHKRFQSVSIDDFQQLLEAFSGRDLSELFTTYVYPPGSAVAAPGENPRHPARNAVALHDSMASV